MFLGKKNTGATVMLKVQVIIDIIKTIIIHQLKCQSLVATSIFGHINGYINLVSTPNIGLYSDEYI